MPLVFLCGNFETTPPYKLFCELRPIENLVKAVTYLPSYLSFTMTDPLPPLRARSLAAAMDIFNGPTKPHRIRQVVGRRRQPLECPCLCVGVFINCCIKILKILHKFDDVVKNDGNGGRRRIVGNNPAMRNDNIYNKLVDCILLSLHIHYNLGLVYIYL